MGNTSMVKSAIFHVSGMSSYADSLKQLAKLNPDWNLSPDQVLDADKAGQKIYRLKFATKPVQLQQDPITGDQDVYIADCPIGHIASEEAGQARNILDNCEIVSITCGIWGGQFKIVDEDFEVETGKQSITATVRIKYREASVSDEDYLDEALFFVEDPKPVKANKKATKSKKEKKKKKPFYKRWWFWAIIISLVMGSCSPSEDTTAETAPETEVFETATSPATECPTETEIITEPEETEDPLTTGQKNALRSAESYLNYSAFSYSGLIKQLEYEGYTTEEATYAADNCGADWSEQALKAAKSYLDYSAFSYTGLIKQLEYEGYNAEQAAYGADNCEADWNAQAARAAESYLEYSSFSRDGLLDQLEYEGYTSDQAAFGVDNCGAVWDVQPVAAVKETEPPTAIRISSDYILNTNTKKFHEPGCRSVKTMKKSNKEYFTGSRDEVIARKFEPCKICNP